LPWATSRNIIRVALTDYLSTLWNFIKLTAVEKQDRVDVVLNAEIYQSAIEGIIVGLSSIELSKLYLIALPGSADLIMIPWNVQYL